MGFKGKDLSGADFSEADIRGTNFSGANLTGTKFRGAKAGLQKRWVVILLIVFLLSAVLLGCCSFGGIAVSVMSYDYNLTNAVKLWMSVVYIFLFITLATYAKYYNDFHTEDGLIHFAIFIVFIGATIIFISICTAGATGINIGFGILALLIFSITFGIVLAGIFGLGIAVATIGALIVAGYVGIAIVGVGVIAIIGTFAIIIGDVSFALMGVIIVVAPTGQLVMRHSESIWLYKAAIAVAATGGTSFYKANLTDADFSKAKLKNTDLRKAILTRTCWQNTEKLDRIRPGNTILKNPQVRELLKTGNGYNKSFQKADLRGANLQGANLENTNFKQADLSEAILHDANLKNTNLTETLAIGTDFTGAYLTGACLEAWNIDSTTILDRVDCQYVFLLEHPSEKGSRERHPHDHNKTFDRGDFEKLYKQLMNTVQFLLKNGINCEAFREAFQKIIDENPEITWESIQKIERKEDDVLVEVTVPETTDKAKIEHTFDITYQDKISKLEAKIDELQILRHQDMKDIAFALSTHPQITQTMNNNPQTNKGIFLDNTQGNVKISGSANIENLNSTITNQINELPTTSEPEQSGIKELLEQLQTAINADENLSDSDKAIALEQVQNLAQASKEPKNSTNQGIAKRAFLMLQGLITGLPAAAKLAETCQKIIPTISAIFGL